MQNLKIGEIKRLVLTCIILIALGIIKVEAQDSYAIMRGSPEDSIMAKNFPGAWKLPNTNFFLKFGGYFRIDAIYDFNGSGSRNQLLMNQIHAYNTPEAAAGPFFNMHVRETRFLFDVREQTDSGRPLKFYLEFDFFDEGLKAGVPRLRHAFVKYGKWTVGQTWTNLSDLRIFPFIMDFSAGDALFGGRSIQVRFEDDIIPQWEYGLSLEMPTQNGIFDAFDVGGTTTPTLPTFAARLSNEREDGIIILGAQFMQLRWDGLKQGPDATDMGWGIVFNGRQKITPRLFATWHASYNKGITSQILIFAGTDQGAVILPDGNIVKEEAITTAIGGGYDLSKSLTFNLAYAYMDRGELDYRPDSTLDRGGMGHANVIWKIDKNVMTGVEYAWGDIRNLDDATGSAHRLQAMIRYAFN